ncbi:MAG: hypothetical protein ACRDON_02855 [Gaiellaceae bacterium]
MMGDLDGLADLERSIAIAGEANSPALARGYKNLSSALVDLGELERAFELQGMFKQAAEHFGQHFEVRWAEVELAFEHYVRGDWDEAIRIANTFIAAVEGGAPHYMEGPCRDLRSLIRLARGDPSGALEDSIAELDFARKVNDLQVLIPALATGAFVLVLTGRPADAAVLFDELLESLPSEYFGWGICSFELAVALTDLGRGNELLGAAARAARLTPWLEAAGALVSGEPARAAEIYGQMGARPQEAFARLNAAERLIAKNRRAEGDAELQRALAFFRSVGARAYIARGEALLAASA